MDCNHTIGLIYSGQESFLVNQTYITEDRKLPDIRFQFCPDCGEYLGDYLLDSVDEILEKFEKERQKQAEFERIEELRREKVIEEHEKWLEQQVAALESAEVVSIPAAGLPLAMGMYVIKEKIR